LPALPQPAPAQQRPLTLLFKASVEQAPAINIGHSSRAAGTGNQTSQAATVQAQPAQAAYQPRPPARREQAYQRCRVAGLCRLLAAVAAMAEPQARAAHCAAILELERAGSALPFPSAEAPSLGQGESVRWVASRSLCCTPERARHVNLDHNMREESLKTGVGYIRWPCEMNSHSAPAPAC